MRRLSATVLKEFLANSDPMPVLLDVREPWEYKICHLDGSIQIPLKQIPDRIQELDAKQETVVICHHGIRSAMVGKFLIQNGFENIINLEGGIDAWAQQVDTSLDTY